MDAGPIYLLTTETRRENLAPGFWFFAAGTPRQDAALARAHKERRQVRGRGAQHNVFRRTLLTPLEPSGL